MRAAARMSTPATNGAAARLSTPATGGTPAALSTSAPHAAAMTASAPATTLTASAAASSAPAASAAASSALTARRNSETSAKRGVFLIEDMKGRQTDVRDFFVAQNKSPCIVLRRIGCGGCECSC
jgi:hypothetical protein